MANLAKQYFTFYHNTRNFRRSESRPANSDMHLVRKSFRNRRKLRRNRTRRTESTNSTETTAGLQIRPRATKQSFRAPWAPRRNTYNPSFATLLDTQLQSSEKTRETQDEQMNVTVDIVAEPATKQQRTTSPPRLPSTSTSS